MDRLEACKLEICDALNDENKPVRKPKVEEIWGLDIKARVHLKAGDRLFASETDSVMAVEIPRDKTVPRISWKTRVNGTVESVIAADGRLFVSTREGAIHCFGSGGDSAHSMSDSVATEKTEDAWTAVARDILKESGVNEGYCMALGLGSGRLVDEIVRQSNLHVIVFEGDANKVNDTRRRLDAGGLYGERIEIISIDPEKAAPSQYFANLIVSEDPKSGGIDHLKSFVEKAFQSLHPYGGMLALQLPDALHADFAGAVRKAGLEKAGVSRKGSLSLLRREGALPGAGAWTHQYADPSNTVVSNDSLVRLPLGVLWFGGSTDDNVLPRHGHGPSPQVVGGRLFIEGPNGISARDVYTGRPLWEVKLPGLGAPFNNTSHQPGANSIGSNFVTVEDGVYVVLKDRWLRLDPATGKTLSEFTLPAGIQAGEKPGLGFLAISGDLMITGVSPLSFEFDPAFRPSEFALYLSGKAKDEDKAKNEGKDKDKTIKNVLDILDKWVGGPIFQRKPAEKDVDFIVRNLDAAINEPSLIKRVPKSVMGANATAQAVQARIDAYLKTRPADIVYNTGLRNMNRLLLKELYPILPYRERGAAGNYNSDYVSSKRLVVLNRYTGKVLWQREAIHGFRHNSICVGDGKIFCIDRLPDPMLRILMFRKKEPAENAGLYALDARTGTVVWKTEKDVFGTWLGYSEKHDILLQSGRPSRDMLMNEPDNRMIAFRGKNGALLWDKATTYRSSCMLHGDWIITDGNATSILTGDPVNWANPITGVEQPWAFHRMYGCNSPIGSTHLITFRSAAAGFYDIERLGGVGNFGGFKASCTSNLIPADGVLNAPDYTRTCLCSYQNQASLRL